jgi:excisionase family DNA binding protein
VLETHHDAEPILVSPRQALRLLDISNSSLYGLLRSGQLRSLHVGRSRRIPLEAIKEFVVKRLAASPANLAAPWPAPQGAGCGAGSRTDRGDDVNVAPKWREPRC